MHALYSLITSPSSSGNARVLQHISLARFHNPFCAMKPSFSNLFKKHLTLFSRNSVFLGRNPAILKDLAPFQHFAVLFCAYLLRLAVVPQFRTHSLPRIARTFSAPDQNFSLSVQSNQIMTSKVTLSPFSIFLDKCFGPVHVPGIFMYLLPLPHLTHRYFSASAHHSDRCFVSSFFSGEKTTFLSASLWAPHNLFILPQSSQSWLHTARLRTPLLVPAALSLLSLLP